MAYSETWFYVSNAGARFPQNAFKEDEGWMDKMQKKKIRRRVGSLITLRRKASPADCRRSSEKAACGERVPALLTLAKKAGLTVESACVLPLFLFGCITIITLPDLYDMQNQQLFSLCQQAKEAGLSSPEADGYGPEEMTLTADGFFRPSQLLLPLPAVPLHTSVCVHAWNGTDLFGGEGAAAGEPMVYMAETGHVIHTDPECSYLQLSIHAVSGWSVSGMVNAYGEKYHACERCSYHQTPGAVVYITEQGDRYHNQACCSGLKRTVLLVKESDAEGCPLCSRCGHFHG